MTAIAPHQRFREARERLQLSHDEVASRCAISAPCVWDIESREDELTTCYSASDVQRFSEVLRIRPIEFFGEGIPAAPLSAVELVESIREECRSRKLTLEQFEDIVGWKLRDSLQPPDRILSDLSLDGLQWLCRELRVDWRRVLAAL